MCKICFVPSFCRAHRLPSESCCEISSKFFCRLINWELSSKTTSLQNSHSHAKSRGELESIIEILFPQKAFMRLQQQQQQDMPTCFRLSKNNFDNKAQGARGTLEPFGRIFGAFLAKKNTATRNKNDKIQTRENARARSPATSFCGRRRKC